MLALALLLSASSGQVLAGPAFEFFARRADAICPARHARFITPADLDWEEEGFLDSLSAGQRRRVAALNGADRRCRDRDGLACPATATLKAIEQARLLPGFSGYYCAHDVPGKLARD